MHQPVPAPSPPTRAADINIPFKDNSMTTDECSPADRASGNVARAVAVSINVVEQPRVVSDQPGPCARP